MLAEYRIKDWVLVTNPSFFLPFGGELPTEGLRSALLLHKLGSRRAERALGEVGPAPGQCYLCLAGETGLIRGPIACRYRTHSPLLALSGMKMMFWSRAV